MSTASDAESEVRVSALQRTLERRVANPLFDHLLRSRLHWPMSRWLLLVEYEGRRSGRRYRFPASYSVVGDDLVVVTPRSESGWWPNFREARRCTVWWRGEERLVVGEVVAGDERERLLAAYLDDNWTMRRWLANSEASSETSSGGDPGGLPPTARDLAVVRFSRSD